MIKKIGAILLLVAMIVGMASCQSKDDALTAIDNEFANRVSALESSEWDSEDEDGTTEEEGTEDSEKETAKATPAKISDKLEDMEFSLNGKAYKLPAKTSDFLDDGWKLSFDDKEMDPELSYMQESWMYLIKDGVELNVSIKNFSMDTQLASKSYIYDITFSAAFFGSVTPDVVFANGITFDTPPKDIRSAYGKEGLSDPADEDFLQYSFKSVIVGEDEFEDEDEEIETGSANISFTEDEGVELLSSLKFATNLAPADIMEPANDGKVPTLVGEYKNTGKMGSTIDDCTITIDGSVYSFPIPLNVLIEDGWVLKEVAHFYEAKENTDEYKDILFPSKISSAISSLEIERNGSKFSVGIFNPDKLAQPIKYCFVSAFSTSYDGGKFELPSGIKNGAGKKDAEAAYGTSADSDDYTLYYGDDSSVKLKLDINDSVITGFSYSKYVDLHPQDAE